MTLARFFDTIGPMLLGPADAETTAVALLGEPSALLTERLALYRRFCDLHRHGTLEGVFAETHGAVVVTVSEARWDKLLAVYFEAHVPTDWELNGNGMRFPEFLARSEDVADLPRWIAELADLEWLEWQTHVSPDVPSDLSKVGPRRLGSTVALRVYQHALLEWLDADTEERPSAPRECSEAALGGAPVLFWRDGALRMHRETPAAETLVVLQAVELGRPTEALADALGLDAARVRAAESELRTCGVVIGGT